MKLASTLSLFVSIVFAHSASAQIIVQDGDNLQAILNAAPSGSIVEIQSDSTFTGSIGWANKDLVLRAGAGFVPVIKGTVTITSSTAPSASSIEGLRLRAGLFVNAFSVTGDVLALDVSNCDITGFTVIDAQKDSTCALDFFRTNARMSFVAQASGAARLRLDAVECGFNRNVLLQNFNSAAIKFGMKRSRVGHALNAYNSSSGPFSVLVESSLLVGPGALVTTPGVDMGTNVSARFVNTTITGHGVGLRGSAQTTGENLLVFGNGGADIGLGIAAGQIANSLIEDGTFAGQNGNFGGTPLVGPDYRLLPGSLGIDAGNDAALALGTRDFYGDARIQDGDGDGVAHVDVGAVER